MARNTAFKSDAELAEDAHVLPLMFTEKNVLELVAISCMVAQAEMSGIKYPV